MSYGTLQVLDTLASASNTTVARFGEDRAFEEIQAALAAHNQITNELMGDFVEKTTDRLRRYGSNDSMAMDELDEYGRADAQKITAGATVGFPLRLYGISLQWTRKFFQNATPAELAAQTAAVMDADVKALQRELKRALFTATNATFVDRLVDGVSLDIKRLINADSQPIPLGPNGETFTAASHTHYLYTAGATLAAADVTALILAVAEHYAIGQVVVAINAAQEATVRALTGFTAITPTFVTPATSSAAIVGAYDTRNIGDRRIGYFGPNYAEVWVKPWVPAGYLCAWVTGADVPLVMRTRDAGGGNLELVFDDEDHPLRARGYEREFGVSVWHRQAAAALFIDSGSGGVYVSPTIT